MGAAPSYNYCRPGGKNCLSALKTRSRRPCTGMKKLSLLKNTVCLQRETAGLILRAFAKIDFEESCR